MIALTRISVLAILLFAGTNLFGTTYFWVGGSGSWTNLSSWSLTSGGTISPTTIPSPSDDIVFDNNSFGAANIIHVNLGLSIISFRSLRVTAPGKGVNFTGGNIFKIYGSLELSPTSIIGATMQLEFESQTSGNIISTYGINIYRIIFQGIGGEWTLASKLEATDINFNHGSLNTAGHEIKANTFNSTSANNRSISLSNSDLDIQSWNINGTNMNLNAGTSSIDAVTFSHTGTAVYYDLTISIILSGDVLTFNKVWANRANTTISGQITYNTLYLGGQHIITFIGSHTFLVDLKAEGVNCTKRLTMTSTGGANFIKASDTVKANNVELQNIHAGGGAVFIATNAHDAGGNSGWIIPPPVPRDLYWVGGQGEWTDPDHWSLSSNGPGGECLPNKNDNVFFDIASFSAGDTLHLDSTHHRCYNMTWTINVPVVVSSPNLNPDQLIKVYGSLRWSSNIIWNTIANVDFVAITAGKTIMSEGNRFPANIRFKGVGGEWNLIDDLKCDSITHNHGIVRTNGRKLSIVNYKSQLTNSRALYLYNSLIEIAGGFAEFQISGTGHNLIAGTSTIRFLSPGNMRILHATALSFHNIEFVSGSGKAQFVNSVVNTYNKTSYNIDCDIEGTHNVNHAVFYGNHTYGIGASSIIQIQDSIEFLSGCSNPIYISSLLDSVACFIHKASGLVQGERLILKDVHTSGGATFNATQSVDLGNNTGWNFIPHTGVDLYWVNGQGNWSDSYHWSYSSGGPGGACVPTPVDNVFFDLNSFSQPSDTVFLNPANGFCLSMQWNTATRTPIFLSTEMSRLWIFGSLKLDGLMIFSHFAPTMFVSVQQGRTIQSEGIVFPYNIHFEGMGGEWLLLDSLSCRSKIFHEKGHLRLQGNVLNCGSYYSLSIYPRGLDIRNAHFKVYSDPQTNSVDWWAMQGSYELQADSSDITFFLGSPQILLGTNDSLKFWNLTIRPFADNARINTASTQHSYFRKVVTRCGTFFTGSNYFDSLVLYGYQSYRFSSTQAQKIREMVTLSDCNNRIKILSSDPPAVGLIHNNTGGCQVNDCDVDNVTVQGGGIFTVQNGTAQGNTAGWSILPVQPHDLYWVNGTGDWSNPWHWSFTSGGPGGGCIPGPEDNVFFDQNSFTGPNDVVFLDMNGQCHNMTWGGYQSNPVFTGANNTNLSVHGSLFFDTLMNTNTLNINFLSDVSGKTVATYMRGLRIVNFNGSGSWNLSSGLKSLALYLHKGSMNTMSTPIETGQFMSTGNQQRSLNLGNSICKVNTTWLLSAINLNFSSGNSHIIMQAPEMNFANNGASLNYHNVTFKDAANLATIMSQGVTTTFNRLDFEASGIIMGKNVFDSLLMYPGMSYQLDVANSQTIGKYWLLRGNNCYPINLRSTALGTQANVTKASGTVSGDFIHMRDIRANGNASFFAGSNSTNTANNTGWVFLNQPGYNYGLGKDTVVCSIEPFILTTDNFNGGKWFRWNDNSTNPTLSVSQSGTYWVRVYYSNDCYVSDTINIIYHIPVLPELGNDTSFCEGDTITLTVYGPVNNFAWNNGSTAQQIYVTKGGTYSVTITDQNNCVSSDTVKIEMIGKPRPDLGGNTHICLNDSLQLDAGAFLSYLWNDSTKGRFLMANDEGYYWVEVTGQCGKGADTVFLNIIDCDFFAPNVFTPNGDGVNDKFEIVIKEIRSFNLVVYNRWGQVLFRSNSLENQWDGTYKGQDCAEGVYFWVAEYDRVSNFGHASSFRQQGSLTLMR